VAARGEYLKGLTPIRRRAFEVAYRMLGSVAEAEDVAQEAMVRLVRTEPPEQPEAWITTVSTRLAIDTLRRAGRETYIGPWLPEPLVGDVAERVEMTESLSQAFLVLLERLTPTERAAFLLREVFEYDYRAIGEVIGRGEASCRQLVRRARKRLASGAPRFDADAAQRDALLERFLDAADHGDLEALEAMLAEDAVLYADGGGKVAAARHPLVGAARIARAFAAIVRKQRSLRRQLVHINGQPGRILRQPDGAVVDVLSVDVAGGRIRAMRIVRNPDKLCHVPPAPPVKSV
jgi:RNA polymerase sigma-70 factor, ECF subfamily